MRNKWIKKVLAISIPLVVTLIFGSGNYALAEPSDNIISVESPAVFNEISTDEMPPTLTIAANPTDIEKVKKGYMRQIQFSGVVEDLGSGLLWPTTIELIDEYGDLSKVINGVFTGDVQGGAWSEGWDINGRIFTGYVLVEAWSDGWDKDGRTYIIRHTAFDQAGNKVVVEAQVKVLNYYSKGEANNSSNK